MENYCNDRNDSFLESLRRWFLYNNPQSSLKSDVRSMHFHPVHETARVEMSCWESSSRLKNIDMWFMCL